MDQNVVNHSLAPVLPIVWLSLKVSGLALLFSSVLGVPFGAWIGLTPFRGRWMVMVILNTGDQSDRVELAAEDRVALLLDGRLVELAETSRFFDSPADPRTAAFLRGEMVY